MFLTRKTAYIVCLIAALSLYVGLIFPPNGEEGLYPATTYEMLFKHDFWNVYFLGGYYGRPPLFNWLMILAGDVFGFSHMLLLARMVTITLTVGSAAILYWFTCALVRDVDFALWTVLCFLSGDLLFRRSWIAYADPTFAFFIFTSIAFMWVGSVRNQQRWLLLAIPALIAAFLSKAMTCYVFYGVTALTLLIVDKKWRYFFHPLSIALHLFALAFPFLWFSLIAHQTGHRALWDLYHQFSAVSIQWIPYVVHLFGHLLGYFARFAPLSIIVIYALLTRQFNKPLIMPTWVKITAVTVVINFLPYWLTPHVDQARYLLPLYPFIALLMAYVIDHSAERIKLIATITLVFFIAMKILLSPFGLPWFEHMSNDYPATARDILNITQGRPLYINDVDSLITTLDEMHYPKAPYTATPQGDNNFYFIGKAPLPGNYKLVKQYHITNNDFALYCYNRCEQQ